VNRFTAKSRIRKVIWRNRLSAVLPLHGQIRGDVVRKPLKESKYAKCRCQRRALHDPELLAVGFVNTVTHGCPMLSQRRDRAVCLTKLLAREWVSSLYMLTRALLGIEKTDRLDRLYGLHLTVVRPRLACLRVHVAAKAPRVWRREYGALFSSEFDEVIVGGREHAPLL